jgi:hypothetical protein
MCYSSKCDKSTGKGESVLPNLHATEFRHHVFWTSALALSK